jgi:hypothetical protein
MSVSFIPADHVLGVLPGGWLWLIAYLIIAFVLSRFLARRHMSDSSSTVLFAILTAIVIYDGFNWSVDNGWWVLVRLLFWIGLIVAIVLWAINLTVGLSDGRGRWTSDRKWSAARGASTLAVITAVLLASNLSFSGEGFRFGGLDRTADQASQAIEQAKKDMRLEFATQLNAAKIDTTSFETECKSVPHICAIIKAQGVDIDKLKAEDAKIWKALKAKADKADVVALPANVSTDKAADSLANTLAPMGWKKGEVVMGDKIDWSKNRYDAGRQAFVKQSITTPTKYAAHLNGSAASDKAAKALVLENTPDELHATFLRGESVIPVQFTKDSCVNGNTGYDGHKVVRFDKICHEAGDIWWVPVGPDGTVYWAAAVRADCGNPSMYVAPYPRNRPAPKVCPEGSDRPGMPVSKGCYNKPNKPHRPPHTPPSTPPTPPVVKKVPVCVNGGGDIKYVPESEAHKYPKPNADGTCAKNPGDDPANNGNAGNGGGKNQDPGPGATTTPTQPPSTPRTNPPTPSSTSSSTSSSSQPAPEPSAPKPSDPATGCAPAPGRSC